MTTRLIADETGFDDAGELRKAIIRKELQMHSEELVDFDRFRDYYDGDQHVKLTQRSYK